LRVGGGRRSIHTETETLRVGGGRRSIHTETETLRASVGSLHDTRCSEGTPSFSSMIYY
jgi:hypothetical protein